MNKVFIIGHIGQDPQVINKTSGNKIVKFSIASNESYKDKQGNKVEATEWHNVTVFGKQADVAEQYFKKGSKILVEGKIKTDKYEKDGQTRYSTGIILSSFEFLDSRVSSQEQSTQQEDDGLRF